jgi:hypothetical protein
MHAVKPRQSIREEELEHGMVGTPAVTGQPWV